MNQKELIDYCRSKSIVFQAYSSLGTSDKKLNSNLLENETVIQIGQKYSKSSAQILLKWAVQQNIGVIPKSISYKHLEDNFRLFDFELAMENMHILNSLNKNKHLCWNPDTVA